MPDPQEHGKVSQLRNFTRDESRQLTDIMIGFAHSPQCVGPMSHAMSEIFGDRKLTDLLRSAAGSESCQSVFPAWFLFDRPIVKDGQTPADVFSGGDMLRLTRGHRTYLERMRVSHLRPYEVRAVHRDEALVLHDLWNGDVVRINERIATRYALPGSTIFARVIEGPEGALEMHGVLSFPRVRMEELVRGLRRAYGAAQERRTDRSEGAFFKDATPWIMHSWLESFRPPGRARRSSAQSGKAASAKRVLQLEVVLEEVKPRVWRRLLVPSTMTLDALSKVLERVMGWESYHLHEFEIDGILYGIPDPEFPRNVRDERGRLLSDFDWKKGSRCFYRYDFGDGWRHRVCVEKIDDPEPGVKYPQCIDGGAACPPEDVGGVGGYAEFLKVLRNPKHEDHDHFREWARRGRRDFDPQAFDVDAANKGLGARVLIPV
jgi:hypothetical protein